MRNPIQNVLSFARQSPAASAIVSRDVSISYRDLTDLFTRMATILTQKGVGPNSIVAIVARPELEAVISLAVMQLGATSFSGAPSILRAYESHIDFVVSDHIVLNTTIDSIVIDSDTLITSASIRPREAVTEFAKSAPVRIVFSSGTTGVPKGVPFTTSYLWARLHSAETHWITGATFMALLGLDTVTGFQTFMWSLLNGRTYLLPSSAEGNFDVIRSQNVSSIKSSPARLRDLLEYAESHDSEISTLKNVEIAGSLLSARIAERCKSLWGVLPEYLYGSTEVGTVTKGRFRSSEPNLLGPRVEDVELEIVDERGESIEQGAIGHIRFRKLGMPDSYWNQGSEAGKGFIDSWFYPGDTGYLSADGNLVLAGRVDDLVNAGGAKFNLLELDSWLEQSGLFDDVASFQLMNTEGETDIGVAFVTSNPPLPETLIRRLKDFLPNLELRHLIRLKTIPRNKLGKIQRNEIVSLVKGE